MHYYMYNQINTYILCIIISYTSLLHPHTTTHPTTEATIQNLETPIQIENYYERSISINCFEKRIEMLPITIVPFINRVLHPGERINIDYGRSLFEEMLFCTFIANRRKWNCGEELIAEQCVWENPKSIMMRAGVPTEDECPQCDIRNNVGEITCQWAVLQEGLYLNQYDPNLHFASFLPRASWVDRDPLRQNLAAREQFYQFSVRNDMHDEVTIVCEAKMERPEYLRARWNGDGGPAVWQKRLNMLNDLNGVGDGTWVCDFLVEATGMHCDGVRVWTPVGVVHPSEQDPPCIDCAWKLTDANILLDMRDCVYDWPMWEPVHEWTFFDDDMSEW